MTKQIDSTPGTYIFPFTAPDGCATSPTNFSTTSNWVTLSLANNNTSLVVTASENTGTSNRVAEIYPVMNGVTCSGDVLTIVQIPSRDVCDCDNAFINSASDIKWEWDKTNTHIMKTYLLSCHSLTATSNKSNSHFNISISSDGISVSPKTQNLTSSDIVETMTVTLKASGIVCNHRTFTTTLTHKKSSLQPTTCYKDIKVTDISYLSKDSGCTITWTYTQVYTDSHQVTTETTGTSSYTMTYTEIYQNLKRAWDYKNYGFYWANHKDCTTGNICYIEFINGENFKIHTFYCYITGTAKKSGSTDFRVGCFDGGDYDEYTLYANDNTDIVYNYKLDWINRDILVDVAANPTDSGRTMKQDLIAEYTVGDQKRIAVIIDLGVDQY